MKVFLSHSNKTEDLPLIAMLRFGFRIAGIPLYVAEHDKQPGDAFKDKLIPMIEASDAMLVLYTKHAASSSTVNWEIGRAGKMKVVFITEWGAKKPTPFEGIEDILLDRANAEEALYDAVLCFSSKNVEKSEKPYLFGVIIDSVGNPRIQYRVSYYSNVDIALNPELIQAQAWCNECQLPLYDNPDLRYRAWHCKACSKSIVYFQDEIALKAKTISLYLRSWKLK